LAPLLLERWRRRELGVGGQDALEAQLRAFWKQALEEGLTVNATAVDAAGFMRHLAERLFPTGTLREAVELVRPQDLFLAYACLQGDPAALAKVSEELIPQAARTVSRIDPAPDFLEEVLQLIRERLLVTVEGRPARLSEYTGRGALGAWVRTLATRLAVDVSRRRRPERPAPEDASLSGVLVGGGNLELGLLRARHQEHFKQALRGALAELSQRDRNVLRLRFLDDLTGEQIARLHGVHATTVMRWLDRAQAEVLRGTRAQLQERFGVEGTELDSLFRALQSDLDMSLRQFLVSA
jgi:RNA polymerase sigma-70 factor (ECF subfamily)